MAKFYVNLSEKGKNLFLLIAITVVVFLALCPFFFFSNPGVPLGWLVGSAIEVACFFLLYLGTSVLVEHPTKMSAGGFSVLFFFLRMALFAGGLVIAGFCTFKWKNNWLNIWSVAAAYLPLTGVMALNFFRANKVSQPLPKKENKEDKVVEVEVEEKQDGREA